MILLLIKIKVSLKSCKWSRIVLLQKKNNKICQVIYVLLLMLGIEISFSAGGPRVTRSQRRKGTWVNQEICFFTTELVQRAYRV